MSSQSRIGIGVIAGVGVLLIVVMLLRPEGELWQFAQMVGALTGGALTLFSAGMPFRRNQHMEPWLGREQLAWIFIGSGITFWGCGEGIWRYYVLTGQSPFPSFADIGYANLPPLIFVGLLLQPSSGQGRRRMLIVLDSLIAMGSLLAIGWYLLLGSLALADHGSVLAKSLSLYYPIADIALLSCVLLLLLRGRSTLYQATARRVGLQVMGVGLCFFAASDFIFNMQQNVGSYIDGTWLDLGWPLGLLTIGLAAYLRRSFPATASVMIEQRLRRHTEYFTVGFAQVITYVLLGILFVVLALNVFSSESEQVAIRPVLLLTTIAVVGLVVVRHLLTMLDNEHLTRRQANALGRLEKANQRIEEQAHMIVGRNEELEKGIVHLKDVQARLANGNLHARAQLIGGELLPLAASLNLMAERLERLVESNSYSQRLTKGLQDLSSALESYKNGEQFHLPATCKAFPELHRLLLVMGVKELRGEANSLSWSAPYKQATSLPVYPLRKPVIQRLYGEKQQTGPSGLASHVIKDGSKAALPSSESLYPGNVSEAASGDQ